MNVDLNKSGHGKKTPKHCSFNNQKLSNIWNIDVDFLGRGCKCMLFPSTMKKKNKNSRIIVQELQSLVASWGHQVSESTIKHHLRSNSLFGGVAQRKPLPRTANNSTVCQMLLELWVELGSIVRWEQKVTFWQWTPSVCLV